MIVYNKFFSLLKERDISQQYLLKNNIMSANTYYAMKNNTPVTTDTINWICNFFQCNPDDIMEYIPDHKD